MNQWGIDVGGTKIEGAIIDMTWGNQAVCRLRVPTEADKGYDHVLSQIGRLVTMLEEQSGIPRPDMIGIGTPGATEPSTGNLKNSNTNCLNGRAVRDDLSRVLGAQARLANDANCFALAEATLGAAQGRDVVLGLIIGTGVGAGLVFHGRLIEGLHGIAGEWGHNPMRGETTRCFCGKIGCVETVIAGPSLERFYREHGGDTVRLPEIAKRAAAGEANAIATLTRLQDKFGEAIAAVINMIDPDAIVIGGGVGNLDLLYSEETRAAIMRHTFNPVVRTEFLRPTMGDSAGVFGAAMLCE